MKAKTVTAILLVVLVQCASSILGAPASDEADSVFDRIMNVNDFNALAHPSSRGGLNLFEGDIKVTKDVKDDLNKMGIKYNPWRGRRAVTNRRDRLWIGADGRPEVPYVIESSLDGRAKDAIRQAIAHWESKVPCMRSRFVRYSGQRKYLSFFRGGGCWSFVGRLTGTGAQRVSIGQGCERMGIVAHEIGHALGFWHEQSRPDRDNYVTIHRQNIRNGMERNFQKQSTSLINSLNVPYDYRSLMHYGSKAFSKNGRDTITRKDGGTGLGNRNGLTDKDAKQATLLYCGNAPQPTNPPTRPPTGCGSLRDKNANCPIWKQGGFCTDFRYKRYMRVNCRKSCCNTQKTCADKISRSRCLKWKNFCKRFMFMRTNCSKTCGEC